MNQRKAKKLRRSLREQNINPNESFYVGIRYPHNNSVTIKLSDDCGRSIYQNLKKGVVNN